MLTYREQFKPSATLDRPYAILACAVVCAETDAEAEFQAVWLAELWQWRAQPVKYLARSPAAQWRLRAFFIIIIVNAAVVFAAPSHRVAGIVLTATLLLIWMWRKKSFLTCIRSGYSPQAIS